MKKNTWIAFCINFQSKPIPEAKWIEFHCAHGLFMFCSCLFTGDVSRWRTLRSHFGAKSVPSCSKVPEPSPRLCRPSGRKSSSIKSATVFTKSFISCLQQTSKDFQRLQGIGFSQVKEIQREYRHGGLFRVPIKGCQGQSEGIALFTWCHRPVGLVRVTLWTILYSSLFNTTSLSANRHTGDANSLAHAFTV